MKVLFLTIVQTVAQFPTPAKVVGPFQVVEVCFNKDETCTRDRSRRRRVNFSARLLGLAQSVVSDSQQTAPSADGCPYDLKHTTMPTRERMETSWIEIQLLEFTTA